MSKKREAVRRVVRALASDGPARMDAGRAAVEPLRGKRFDLEHQMYVKLHQAHDLETCRAIPCLHDRIAREQADAWNELRDALDPGIRESVRILRDAGVETFESCQGGEGHAYPEPTVRFHGERSAGFHALAAAQVHGLSVLALRRTWPVNDGEPTGPWWEIVFRTTVRA